MNKNLYLDYLQTRLREVKKRNDVLRETHKKVFEKIAEEEEISKEINSIAAGKKNTSKEQASGNNTINSDEFLDSVANGTLMVSLTDTMRRICSHTSKPVHHSAAIRKMKSDFPALNKYKDGTIISYLSLLARSGRLENRGLKRVGRGFYFLAWASTSAQE